MGLLSMAFAARSAVSLAFSAASFLVLPRELSSIAFAALPAVSLAFSAASFLVLPRELSSIAFAALPAVSLALSAVSFLFFFAKGLSSMTLAARSASLPAEPVLVSERLLPSPETGTSGSNSEAPSVESAASLLRKWLMVSLQLLVQRPQLVSVVSNWRFSISSKESMVVSCFPS